MNILTIDMFVGDFHQIVFVGGTYIVGGVSTNTMGKVRCLYFFVEGARENDGLWQGE